MTSNIWNELDVAAQPDTVVISTNDAHTGAGRKIRGEVYLVLSSAWAVELAHKILAQAKIADDLLADAVKDMPAEGAEVPHA
jgi:hypothetical protein